MCYYFRFCFPLLVLLTASKLTAEDSALFQREKLQQTMLYDLDNVKNIIQAHYAPIYWKQEHLSWDLEEEVEKAKQRVFDTYPLSVKSYQQNLRTVFNSMHDYHAKLKFFSTESATLPLQIGEAEGRYFIQYINQNKLSSQHYPVHVGDEVIAWDGRPIHEVVQELKEAEFGVEEGSPTDLAYTCLRLTERHGLLGTTVPQGPVVLTLKSVHGGKVDDCELVWEYKAEKVKTIVAKSRRQPLLKHLLTVDPELMDGCEQGASIDYDNPHARAAYKSFLPKMGTVIVDGDETQTFATKSRPKQFYWYIYETPDRAHRIGYLRIPIYVPVAEGSDLQQSDFLHALKEFEEIIKKMESMTDALIIDQVNNPGGYTLYYQTLASMLTTKTMNNLKRRLILTQEEVYEAAFLLKKLEKIHSNAEAVSAFGSEYYFGAPINYQSVRLWMNYCQFIIDQWSAGKQLTDPIHTYMVSKIHPHPRARYSKPLIVLANERSISGGDFFPAILADNERATIFGTRTAGAGGNVTAYRYPNSLGVAYFSLTGSLAERVNETKPLEDLGVTPHVIYEPTVQDMQMGYVGYKRALEKAIQNLLSREAN